MNSTLAKMLGKTQEELEALIAKLEESCGYPSEDVRLAVENRQAIRDRLTQLGLDPDDTTDEELYHSLRGRYRRDSDALDRALGVDIHTSMEARAAKAVQLVEHAMAAEDVWAVKNAAARKILAKNPPKHAAKLLRYRSVASMIKREDITEVYLAAGAVEPAAWQKKMAKEMAQLGNTAYELRPLKVFAMPEKYSGMPHTSYAVADGFLGAAALWPAHELSSSSVLTLALLLLESVKGMDLTGYSESLHSLNPSLRWWAGCDYLIHSGDSAVSFNIKDVAINHLNDHHVSESTASQGRQSLWQELQSRYGRISGYAIGLTQQDSSQTAAIPIAGKLPAGRELAAELAMVE